MSAILHRLTTRADAGVASFFGRSWPSYGAVLLLQLKVLWGMWWFRDLTTGDTSAYFARADLWAQRHMVDIVWSPLYTAFYGVFFEMSSDAYLATTAHRLAIVLAAAVGVLAVMRMLLPPAIALAIAVWWAVMPINFNTLYEVHLFALLPILAILLVIGHVGGAKGRGIALGMFVVSAALLRNELFVAAVLFALLCLLIEMRLRPDNNRIPPRIRTRVFWYLGPLVVAMLVCALFYSRSIVRGPALSAHAAAKHTVNMCQVYAFGYAQRHTNWRSSPWTDCYGLAQATFGRTTPTLGQMIAANPRAVLEHMAWNVALVPAGLQLALFNRTWGGANPDYAPVDHPDSPLAVVLSCAALAAVVFGARSLWRDWPRWWKEWFRPRASVWGAILCISSVAVPIILTQRPRPSYLFALTMCLMAVCGTAVFVLTESKRAWRARVAAVVLISAVVFVPPYFAVHRSGRPLAIAYTALRQAAPTLNRLAGRIVLGDFAAELQAYTGLHGAASYEDYRILQGRTAEEPLDRVLDEAGVSAFFVQPRIRAELDRAPGAADFLTDPSVYGWQRRILRTNAGGEWILLYRGSQP